MIFVYVLIYMDFILELPLFTQNSVQISAASHCHSGEVWINCFASFLPRAVPDRRIELAQIGRRIAAVYYLEQMHKADALGMSYAAQGLERVEALWRFADSLCA